MKGLELPVNMIIVIAVAVLVLVVIAAFFAGQTTSGFNTVSLQNAFAEACGNLRLAYSCSENGLELAKTKANLKASEPDKEYSVADLCRLKGIQTFGNPNPCLKACGCVV